MIDATPPGRVSAYEWYRAPTSSGLFYGALIGAVLIIIMYLRVVLMETDNPAMLLTVVLIGAMVGVVIGSLLGGLSGAAIGMIAVAVRRMKWRAGVHLLSCLFFSPLLFAGPLSALGNASGSIFDVRFQFFLLITAAGGIGHGFLLFGRLCSVAKTDEQESRSSSEDRID
ncbi:hypothetical protein [Blastopirellula marina]|uniref:hypothetical protein n=1 Tax=Blastopirellula marina TaxID=124 RepID=UPI0011B0BBC4|nr:hypothetical protein [Blastopirellula marina]